MLLLPILCPDYSLLWLCFLLFIHFHWLTARQSWPGQSFSVWIIFQLALKFHKQINEVVKWLINWFALLITGNVSVLLPTLVMTTAELSFSLLFFTSIKVKKSKSVCISETTCSNPQICLILFVETQCKESSSWATHQPGDAGLFSTHLLASKIIKERASSMSISHLPVEWKRHV